MKSKKSRKLIFFSLFVVIIVVSIYAYQIFNNGGKQVTLNFSVFEKRWLAENQEKVIDIAIPNDLPLYGKDGKGIFFSFLHDFIEATELDFNMTSYNITQEPSDVGNIFKIVKHNETLTPNDFVFAEDYYVVLSRRNTKISSLMSLNQKEVGILTADVNHIKSYLKEVSPYYIFIESIEQLITNFNDNEFNYIIIPRITYLDYIIQNKYYVTYILNDLVNKYVLRVNPDQTHLNPIFAKYFQYWRHHTLASNYNDEMFNLYCTLNNINEETKVSFRGERYIYGFYSNPPYDAYVYNEFKGINQAIINGFADFAKIEFTYKNFETINELQKGLNNNEVDVTFNSYNFGNLKSNIYSTMAPIIGKYLILGHIRHNYVFDSLEGLKEQPINIKQGTKLMNFFNKNTKALLKPYNKMKEIEKKNLLGLDYNTYQYYKSKQLKNYNIIYEGLTDYNYNYLVNNDKNKLFFDMFQFYLNNINYQEYVLVGLNELLLSKSIINLSFLWLYIILVPILLIIIGVIIKKRKQMLVSKKYLTVRHIDPLTSLKNRYYLKSHIEKWEANKIYPQTIIMIDLNNLKEINDSYGYEEGDRLIKAGANILINHQLENTDIIRTDGDEFMIYLVGYDETAIADYIRKLEGLFKNLPYERGVAIGYSMITDDIKLIDDAMNEAVLEMLTSKEIKNKSDN